MITMLQIKYKKLQIEIYLNFFRDSFPPFQFGKISSTYYVATHKTIHVTTRVLLEQNTWLTI